MRTYALAVAVVFFSVGSFNLKSQTEIRTYADAHDMFLLRDELSRERRPAGFLAAQVALRFQ